MSHLEFKNSRRLRVNSNPSLVSNDTVVREGSVKSKRLQMNAIKVVDKCRKRSNLLRSVLIKNSKSVAMSLSVVNTCLIELYGIVRYLSEFGPSDMRSVANRFTQRTIVADQTGAGVIYDALLSPNDLQIAANFPDGGPERIDYLVTRLTQALNELDRYLNRWLTDESDNCHVLSPVF